MMKMRIRHWYIISVTLIFLWSIPPLQAVERIALVIGNGAYELKPLDNPTHDAEDVAKMLRQVGFQAPIVKINADQATMDSAIAAFGERLHKGAVGLFYYAGHAVQYGGENYLIPIGAMNGLMASPEQLKYKAVNASYVLQVMESAGNGLNIVILDACRDNPFKSKYATRGLNSPRGGLAEMPKANGSVIAYATAPGETAKDGSGRNSPYTKQLLQWMQKPNLPIELMLKEVGKGVKRETQEGQRPWYESSIDGDFYFVEQSAVSVPSTPTVTTPPVSVQPPPQPVVIPTVTAPPPVQPPPQPVAMIPPRPPQQVAMIPLPSPSQLAQPAVAESLEEAVRTLQLRSPVRSIAISPNGKWLASGNADATIKIFELASGREILSWKGHQDKVLSIAFSPDGRLLASGGSDGATHIWEAGTGQSVRSLEAYNFGVSAVTFSPDGRMLAVSGGSKNFFGVYHPAIKLWEVATGTEIRSMTPEAPSIFALAFRTDGQVLASSQGNTITLWKVSSGEKMLDLVGHAYEVRSLAFSLDGRRLASGSDDETVKLWDAETGQTLNTLKGHTSPIWSVKFSPNGRWLVSSSGERFSSKGGDYLVRLWDVSTGREIRSFHGHEGAVAAVSFSQDGQLLASGSEDNTVKLWPVPPIQQK